MTVTEGSHGPPCGSSSSKDAAVKNLCFRKDQLMRMPDAHEGCRRYLQSMGSVCIRVVVSTSSRRVPGSSARDGRRLLEMQLAPMHLPAAAGTANHGRFDGFHVYSNVPLSRPA